jgi:hypothetical protein
MESREYVELCHEVDKGRKAMVENVVRHEKGKVLACNRRRIEEETEGRRRSWPMEECEIDRTM